MFFFFFFQAEDGIRDLYVTGVQTCALPILRRVAGCADGWWGVLTGTGDRRARGVRHFRDRAADGSRRGPAHTGVDVRRRARGGGGGAGRNADELGAAEGVVAAGRVRPRTSDAPTRRDHR